MAWNINLIMFGRRITEKILASDLCEVPLIFEFLPKLRCSVFRIEASVLEKIQTLAWADLISLLYINLLSIWLTHSPREWNVITYFILKSVSQDQSSREGLFTKGKKDKMKSYHRWMPSRALSCQHFNWLCCSLTSLFS